MKCFIAIDEDLLLKLWMLDPQLVAPFSQAPGLKTASEMTGVQQAKKRSQNQLRECRLTIQTSEATPLCVAESKAGK